MTAVPDHAGGWQIEATGRQGSHPVTLWRHESGAAHLHWDRPDSRPAFGISFDTPAADDGGAAHVLEHWIGAGSADYPMSSALLTAHHRCGSGFLNGFTESGRTACAYTADTPRDQLALLAVVLDAVYRPLLRGRDFLREGCRATAAGGWTGIVYNEMFLKAETDAQWVTRLLCRAYEPDGHRQFRHEGVPSALVALTAEQTRGFHQRYYRPERAFSFLVGSADAETRRALGTAHSARQTEPVPRAAGPGARGGNAAGAALLHPPPRLRDRNWLAASLSWPATGNLAWSAAFDARDRLRAGWRGAGPGRLVCGPVLTGNEVTVAAVLAAEDLGSSAAASQHERLACSLSELLAAPGRQHPPRPLGPLFAESYQSLPAGIGWGLRQSALRAAGLDPIIGPVDCAVTPRLRRTLLCAAGQLAAPPEPPTQARLRGDARCWAGPASSQRAADLPISLLRDTRAEQEVRVQELVPGLHYMPSGPAGVYGVLTVALTAEIVPALGPMVRMLAALARPALAGPLPALVRMAGSGAVLDLLCPEWSPGLWRDLVERAAAQLDTPSGLEQAERCVRVLVHAGSGQLLVAPQELAESSAFAAISPAGATQDAVSGLAALVAWRAMLTGPAAISASGAGGVAALPAALAALAAAPVQLLAVGAEARGRAERMARPMPAAGAPAEGHVAVHTPVSVGQGRDRFAHAVAWPIPSSVEPAVAAVLACDLRRRYAHRIIREQDGAYGAHAFFDPLRAGICIWTQADPVGPARVEQLLAAVGRGYTAPDDDDVETARSMAGRPVTHPPESALELLQTWLRLSDRPLTRASLLRVSAADLVDTAGCQLTVERGRGVSIS